jgi:ABC-type branched-subunit amino acid transport system ATPase component
MRIDSLKNLKDLDEISFEDKPITGIFGPNCCGKSTILHALACCYQPPAGSENHAYTFQEFFVPNTDAIWKGSRLVLTHSYTYGSADYKRAETTYEKRTVQWAPRRYKRPARHAVYLGVGSCVPQIELQRSDKKVNYTTITKTDVVSELVRKAMAKVLNRKYDEINEHTAGARRYCGVRSSGIRYSALSMGAGEQRLFHLLDAVFSSPKFGLILVDELDLLLHGDALERFLNVVSERATAKKLQIVFTSHREMLLDFPELVNVRHIHNQGGKTRCLNETKPDAVRRLTGKQAKPLEILVEDDLATAIVNKVAGQLGMKRFVATTRFGAALNGFVVLAGMILKGAEVVDCLCVLDGDVYTTEAEREERARQVICGDSPEAAKQRVALLEAVTQLALLQGQSPEMYLHGLLVGLDEASLDPEGRELVSLAREIEVPENSHDYLRRAIEELGLGHEDGYRRVVDLVATTPEWSEYVKPVSEWLESKRDAVGADALAGDGGAAT